MTTELTLTKTLAKLGYTHKQYMQYSHNILNKSGAIVFTGDSQRTWDWVNAGCPKEQ